MSKLPVLPENFKKICYIFFELLPFAFFRVIAHCKIGQKTCYKDISKTISAINNGLGQRVDYLVKRIVRSSLSTSLWFGAQCFINTISSFCKS